MTMLCSRPVASSCHTSSFLICTLCCYHNHLCQTSVFSVGFSLSVQHLSVQCFSLSVIRDDGIYHIIVDQVPFLKGNILEDLTPPLIPPKEIDDPEDKMSEEWDEREKWVGSGCTPIAMHHYALPRAGSLTLRP